MSSITDVPADLQAFMDTLHEKIKGHVTRGDTQPFLDLWSRAADASIMAAVGGYNVGYDKVSELLLQISPQLGFDTYTPEILTACAEGDLAASVELEHCTMGGGAQQMTLRTTHVYRREAGDWRLLHRHAEELTPVGGGDSAS